MTLRSRIAIALALLTCAVTPVLAGPQEDAAINAAIAAMANEDYARANAILVRAVKQAPADTRMWYFLGETYNHLRQFELGVKTLRMAESLGHDSPHFRQALGEALLGAGEPKEALAELEKGPNTARNHIARAGALMGMDKPDAALKQLDLALELDPRKEPQTRLLRAQALAQLGRGQDATDEIALGRQITTDSVLLDHYARLEGTLSERLPPARPRPWGLTLSLGSGYNDNVSLSPSHTTAAFANQTSEEDDFFLSAELSGWYRFLGDEETGATAQIGGSHMHYIERDKFKELRGYGSVSGHHTVAPFRFEGGLLYEHTMVGGDEFSRERAGWGTTRWYQSDWTRSSLTLQASNRAYFFDTLDQEDRDGWLYMATLRQDFRVPLLGRNVRIDPYVQVGTEKTEGNSAENDFQAAGVHVRVPIVARLEAFGDAAYLHRPFEHRHLRTGFLSRRKDRTRDFTLGLRWEANENTFVALRGDLIRNSSSLGEFYAYRQKSVTLSVTFVY